MAQPQTVQPAGLCLVSNATIYQVDDLGQVNVLTALWFCVLIHMRGVTVVNTYRVVRKIK